MLACVPRFEAVECFVDTDCVVGTCRSRVCVEPEREPEPSPPDFGGAPEREALFLRARGLADVFGAAVLDAGDVNGDGFRDLAGGAPGAAFDGCNGSCGRVYVFHGSETGVETEPSTILNGENLADGGLGIGLARLRGPEGLSLAIASKAGRVYLIEPDAAGLPSGAVDRVATRIIEREPGYERFALQIYGLGDTDGDGQDELGVWAFTDRRVGCLGVNTLVLGQTSTLFVYGAEETLALERPTAERDCECLWLGGTTRDCHGRAAILATDVDEDGLSDLVRAAPGADHGYGRLYVYLGRPEGLASEPDHVIEGPCEKGAPGATERTFAMRGPGLTVSDEGLYALSPNGCGDSAAGWIGRVSAPGEVEEVVAPDGVRVQRILAVDGGLLSAADRSSADSRPRGWIWFHPREGAGFGPKVELARGEGSEDQLGVHLATFSPRAAGPRFVVATAPRKDGVWLLPLP